MSILIFFISKLNAYWITIFGGFHESKSLQCQGKNCKYGFLNQFENDSAIVLNCTSPPLTAIQLNNNQMMTTQKDYSFTPQRPNSYKLIIFDVYFTSPWLNDIIRLDYESIFTTFITYSTQDPLKHTQGFCQSMEYEVQTYYFYLPYTDNVYTYPKFQIFNNQVEAYIRHILVAYQTCSQDCLLCTGPQASECTSWGTVYSRCSIRQSLESTQCVNKCPSKNQNIRSNNRICIQFANNVFQITDLTKPNPAILVNWNIIYDSNHLDSQDKTISPYFYGVFHYNEGTYIALKTKFENYPLSVSVDFIICNSIPSDSGLSFYIDGIYFGSMYFDGINYQFDNVELKYQGVSGSIGNCLTSNYISLDMFFYTNLTDFMFTIKGNFTQPNTGWILRYVKFSTGYCPQNCLKCDAFYKCLICDTNLARVSDGTCSNGCPKYSAYNGTFCVYYDQVTKYSKYLVKQFEDFSISDTLNQTFIPLTFTTDDFQKGPNIFWSYEADKIVFGGKYVWVNAHFYQIYNLQPHHSLTIYFSVLFGQSFPNSISNFLLYYINDGTPKLVYKNSNLVRVEQISTYNPQLKIDVQCYGVNVINSYCAIYNYYIVVHYCRPYCLQCTNDNDCQLWDTYDSNIIKLKQQDCLQDQFVDEYTFTCENCPNECLTCFNEYECLTCKPNYYLYKTVCLLNCLVNQYYDGNNCQDCHYSCKQCKSFNYCIHCESLNLRYLENGQCKCYDGYYDQLNNIKCQSCNILCLKCNGPTNQDCLSCIQLPFIIQNSQTCQCQNGYFFDYNLIQCKQCQSQCETCFGDSNQKCLTCFTNQNRILIGLQCICQEGYYNSDVSDICIQCPNIIDITLVQCYKNCGDGSQIWFDQSCATFSCLTSYTNLDNKCVPICGDGNIVGDEQCDDGNNTQYDGCFQCKFQCQSHCTTCNNLTTFPCLDVCGDGYVTGQEECDDANSLPNDGCFLCKLECQPSCTKCIKGICYDCQNFGWVLDPNTSLCIGSCGDTYIVGLEECDDGYNLNWNDHCYQCKRRCRDDCKTCSEDRWNCIECVQFGYQPFSYYCNPICGDGFLAINTQFNNSEQCDDNNLIGYDGCGSNCMFQCQVSTICITCNNNRCQQCDSKYYLNVNKNKCLELCNDGIQIGIEQCDDGNSLLNDGCYDCKINCQQSCLNCTIQGCQQCKQGYYLLHNMCQNICGDKTIVEVEDCDDGNLYPFDGCHQCRYQCQPSCLNCYQGQCLQCKDNYLLEFDQCSDLLNFSQPQPKDQVEIFIEFCEYQLRNICYECKHGFQLNVIVNQCQIIQKTNEISKNIQYPYYQNYQTFIEYCQFSFMGICIKCHDHYDFDYQTQLCVSICGDGMISGKEQCEDGNAVQFDGCYNCKYQCSEYCAYCWKSECQSCEKGRILVPETNKCELEQTCDEYGTYYDEIFNICLSLCGDGIIAQFEQCDDGNNIQYDGCFQCMYSCSDDCSQCIQGVCIKECQLGYYYSIDEQICQPFCGDGITVKPFEECDDGNEENNDGCFHCKLQCIINCEVCDQQNSCSKCQNGYQLIQNECHLQNECQIENCEVCLNQSCDLCNEGYILIDEDCIPQCGDGIVNEQELCDDGNDIDGDGCDSDCQPSSNSLCKNSECIILNYPIMQLKFEYELNGIQYVTLTYDQPMKLNDRYNQKDLEHSLQFSIKNQNDSATFMVNFVKNPTFEISIIEIKVEVQFLIYIEKPELVLIFDNKNILLNSDDLPIEQNEITIELLTSNILNQNQQQTATSIIFVNEYILKVILIIVIFAFITGQFDIISNIFDVIQQLYYIKYINIRIGFNLFQFFELFKFIQLDTVYTKINPQDQLFSILEYYPSEKVFENDGRNANYLVNLTNQASVYILFIFSFYSMRIICMVFYQKIFIQQFHKYTSTQLKVVLIIQQKIIQILKSQFHPQLLGIFFSMVYEYAICTFLAIKYSKNSVQGKIGFSVAIVILLFIIVKLISNLKSYPSINKAKKESFKAQKYYSYLCVQKILYMLILIFFYNSCVIQILLNLLNEFQISLFTFIFQLMPTVHENRKQIISHSIQFLIYASYLGNVFFEEDPNKLILIGWIIITLMSLLISSTLILDILYLIQPLIKSYFSKKSQNETLKNQEIFYIVENPVETL